METLMRWHTFCQACARRFPWTSRGRRYCPHMAWQARRPPAGPNSRSGRASLHDDWKEDEGGGDLEGSVHPLCLADLVCSLGLDVKTGSATPGSNSNTEQGERGRGS